MHPVANSAKAGGFNVDGRNSAIQQLKKRSQLINLRLFLSNRVFALSNLAALINYCATFAITFLQNFRQ